MSEMDQSATAAMSLQEQWHTGRLWSTGIDGQLKQGWKRLDASEQWTAWRTHLRSRKTIPALAKLVVGKAPAELWSTDDSPLSGELTSWRRKLADAVAAGKALRSRDFDKLIARPLAGALSELGIDGSLRIVVVAWHIDRLAGVLDADDWWQVVLDLYKTAAAASLQRVSDDTDATQAVVATLLAGELPLVLSYLLPELKPLRELRPEARTALGEGLLSLTDGEGLVAAEFTRLLPLLTASWTRCRAVGERFKKGCWSSSAETQYEWLVRQAIRLTTSDGSVLLAGADNAHWTDGVLSTAIALAGDDSDRAAAATRLGDAGVVVKGRTRVGDLPDASVNSEWAGAAVLASGWGADAATVAVTYRGDAMQFDIAAGGQRIFAGDWLSHSTSGGQALSPVGHWEEQCWFSDDEIDYLDVAIDLSNDVRLERQVILLKQDDALFLHEIVLTKQDVPQQLTHEAHLPLAAGLRFVPEQETREALLTTAKGRVLAAVMPLALPEWRVDTRPGELTLAGHHVELSQQQQGVHMSVPLWIDLNARRAKRQRTWRQLTVAEKLDRQPPDVAVGYRVQSDREQWLIYRSLAGPANRSVLGQNLSCESTIVRFSSSGDVHELIEIEGDQ